MPSKSLLIAVLLCLCASPTPAKVSLSQWEGTPHEDFTESGEKSKGWVDDSVEVPEADLNELQNPAVEVVFSPRRQLQTNNHKSHKDSGMVPVSATSAKDIRDETATTGENANKRLPKNEGQANIQHSDVFLANQTVFNLYY
jgi:hypothetical protein